MRLYSVRFFAPLGLVHFPRATHGLRRGLHSYALRGFFFELQLNTSQAQKAELRFAASSIPLRAGFEAAVLTQI